MGTQQCTQIGENGFSAPFLAIRVHCCYELRCKLRRELRRELRRVAQGLTSASTAMTCRRRSIGGRLSLGRKTLGRKNRLCASGAAARFASSPRQQPMQAPEVPFVFSPEEVGTWHPRRTSQGCLSPSRLCSCSLMSCICGRWVSRASSFATTVSC